MVLLGWAFDVAPPKSAVRWLRANATRLGIDPHRIVAAGGFGDEIARRIDRGLRIERFRVKRARVLYVRELELTEELAPRLDEVVPIDGLRDPRPEAATPRKPPLRV